MHMRNAENAYRTKFHVEWVVKHMHKNNSCKTVQKQTHKLVKYNKIKKN